MNKIKFFLSFNIRYEKERFLYNLKNHFSYLDYIPKIMRYFIYSNIIFDISLFIMIIFQIELSDIMENIIYSFSSIYILIELIYIIELISDKK